jgi:hypothetical protein
MDLFTPKWTLFLVTIFLISNSALGKTYKKQDKDIDYKKHDDNLNNVSQGKDEKAEKEADKLQEEEESVTGAFRLTKETVEPIEGGVMMELEYESTSAMKVYWKKVINGDKNPYWIPIQGEEDRAKIEIEENRLGEGYTGSSSLKIQHDNPAELKLIATFYNKQGNLLYEYSPDMEAVFAKSEDATEYEAAGDSQEKAQDDENKKSPSQEVKAAVEVPQSGLFTNRAIDVLMHPKAVQKVTNGQEVKVMCAFLVPKVFHPVIEWVRVRYQGLGENHIFFTKNVTVLSTEKEWVSDEVAKDTNVDVVTKKHQLEMGTLVTSELKISAINADHEGIYTCHLTENTPTPYTFISAFTEILPIDQDSPYPKSKVFIKFFTCDDMFKTIPEKTITIKQGVPNCFSCGGYGYPQPRVGIFKDGKQLSDSSTSEMSLGRDVQATTYVLNNPTLDDQGVYACVATNGKGDAYWVFEVVVE